MQSCFWRDNLTVHSFPVLHSHWVVWLAQGCQAMPSTACYYAANQGDNPCKPVTDSHPHSHLCVESFFFWFCSYFSLHPVILLTMGKRKCSPASQSLFWFQFQKMGLKCAGHFRYRIFFFPPCLVLRGERQCVLCWKYKPKGRAIVKKQEDIIIGFLSIHCSATAK